MKTIFLGYFGLCAIASFVVTYVEHWHLPLERVRLSAEERLSKTRWCDPIIVDRSLPMIHLACGPWEALIEVRARYRNPYDYGGRTTLFLCIDSHGKVSNILRPHEL